MNEVQGIVRRIADGTVWVETQPRSGCGRCRSQGGCSTVSLSRLFCATPRLFSLASSLSLNVGDVVIIGMDERLVLKSALMAYALPPALLLLGAWLGRGISSPASDVSSIVIGFAAFGLGILGVKLWARRLNRLRARPAILRKISGPVLTIGS